MILCRTILVLNHGIPCPWVTVYGLYDPEGPKSIQLPLVLVSTNVWQVRLLQTLNMLCNLSLQARNMFTERPEFEAQGWNGLFAPRGTPPEIIARLNAAARFAVESDLVKARFKVLSSVAPDSDDHSPEVLQALVTRDVARFRKLLETK